VLPVVPVGVATVPSTTVSPSLSPEVISVPVLPTTPSFTVTVVVLDLSVASTTLTVETPFAVVIAAVGT
jgi:hypothetical protein